MWATISNNHVKHILYMICIVYPRCSMYGIICLYIYHKNGPNAGKYSIHGASGYGFVQHIYVRNQSAIPCNTCYLKFVLANDDETVCRVATVSLPCASGQIEKKWPGGVSEECLAVVSQTGGVPPNAWFVMECPWISCFSNDDFWGWPYFRNHHSMYRSV